MSKLKALCGDIKGECILSILDMGNENYKKILDQQRRDMRYEIFDCILFTHLSPKEIAKKIEVFYKKSIRILDDTRDPLRMEVLGIDIIKDLEKDLGNLNSPLYK